MAKVETETRKSPIADTDYLYQYVEPGAFLGKKIPEAYELDLKKAQADSFAEAAVRKRSASRAA
jgi:hypothetical protein